jgi:hypothetical protein
MTNEQNRTGAPESKEQLVAALESFRSKMEDYSEFLNSKAKYWGAFYWTTRSALIVFGISMSTDAINAIAWLSPAKPFLGLVVALITAFDVLCKSETKYKGFYKADDSARELKNSIALLIPRPEEITSEKIAQVESRYAEINKSLQNFIV